MTNPATPTTSPESERLRTLQHYAILDTPAEPAFDRLAAEAARIFGAAASAITIVAEDRCWFKARFGITEAQMPRQQSLCGYAFRSSGIFTVPDARLDARFCDTPLVAQGGIRFYVGVPLLVPEGCSLGTLCVLDPVPRQPTALQIDNLRALAGEVVDALLARRRLRPPPSLPSAKPKRTVLIVDDEESVRTLVRVLIERRDVETIVSPDGRDALAKLRAHAGEIGAVLTDVHMPEMNGLEFIRTLRANGCSLPVVVMCGRVDDALLGQLTEQKVACVLHKPFSMAELEAVIALLPAAP
ncbi:MAG: response regulator [Opitutaceae bacterium]|nr:response regulator [Opitutaceae bacterium]